MAPGSKRSSMSSNSSLRSPTNVATPTPQTEDTSPTPSSSTRTSAAGASSISQRHVRGPTLGKRTRALLEGNNGKRLHVYVTQGHMDFCGKKGTQASNELGSQIRRFCPIDGFYHTWKLVPSGLKEAIIQRFRDIFEVTENNVEFTPLVQKVICKKASKIYADWKSRMSDHYEKVKEKGEDAYQHPIKGASLDEWKFMIDHIFNDPKWQPRKNAGKKNRNAKVDGFTVRSRLHTMGSKSFVVAITTEADKSNGNVPDFPERYKASKLMKDGGWIDPQCQQLYERMLAMKEEAKELGISLPTDEEYSKKVLGEARYYFRGMGVGPRPLSSSASEELQQVQSQMELICEERDKEREENAKRWENARIRHEEEREEARILYEALQREQAQRDEEARARHEALQKELATFKAILMSQMDGRNNVGSS